MTRVSRQERRRAHPHGGGSRPVPVTYVVPLRSDEPLDAEAGAYLRWLSEHVERVVVVDGSPEAVAEANRAAFASPITFLRPDPGLRAANGKVAGVLTGLAWSDRDHVIVADDDVRYSPEALIQMVVLMGEAEAVFPQNVLRPRPWHARWDTARTLIHRALGHDMPGTVGVRRSFLLAHGGYDGDVLFENLELARTVEACGGRVIHARDLFVDRLPPSTHHFWSQRVRHAYDEFARPPRMALWLSVLPATAWGVRRGRPAAPLGMALGSIALAEFGRRRGSGRTAFRPTDPLWAPVWLTERAICAWLAVAARLAGGVRYRGVRFERAATPVRRLRRTRSHLVPSRPIPRPKEIVR